MTETFPTGESLGSGAYTPPPSPHASSQPPFLCPGCFSPAREKTRAMVSNSCAHFKGLKNLESPSVTSEVSDTLARVASGQNGFFPHSRVLAQSVRPLRLRPRVLTCRVAEVPHSRSKRRPLATLGHFHPRGAGGVEPASPAPLTGS